MAYVQCFLTMFGNSKQILDEDEEKMKYTFLIQDPSTAIRPSTQKKKEIQK